MDAIKAQDLSAVNPSESAAVSAQLLAHIGEQSKHITALGQRIGSDAHAIKWRDVKIESITFQLARLKAWKFGAKTERVNAEQRSLFEETLAAAQDGKTPEQKAKRQPKREALPAHLARVDTRIDPENTNCPTPEWGQPMVRVGEDISERLDIIPAQFFVQRQIRGK